MSIVTILGKYMHKIWVKQNAFLEATVYLSYPGLTFTVAEKLSRKEKLTNT